MHAAIADKREELVELCRRYRVARLEVFGSAARATDFDPQTSDADFLVEFELDNGRARLQQYLGFAEELRRTLGRPVDLVESGAVQPLICAPLSTSRASLSMRPDARILLADVDRAAADIARFIEGMDLETCVADTRTQAAIGR